MELFFDGYQVLEQWIIGNMAERCLTPYQNCLSRRLDTLLASERNEDANVTTIISSFLIRLLSPICFVLVLLFIGTKIKKKCFICMR